MDIISRVGNKEDFRAAYAFLSGRATSSMYFKVERFLCRSYIFKLRKNLLCQGETKAVLGQQEDIFIFRNVVVPVNIVK